jgi:hypothetical protein
MKKIVLSAALIALVLAGLYADGPFTVQSVSGRVEKQDSSGGWTAVRAGETLTENTVVRTGLNSTLTVKSGEKAVTVRAVQNGAIGKLAEASAAGGVRISGNVVETDTSRLERGSGRISTASARASNAAEDEALAEE